MVYAAIEWANGAPMTCVLRVDNQAAVNALIKGSSSSNLVGVLVNGFWNVAARGNTRWWIEYVNAKSNSDDFPSGQCAPPLLSRCDTTHGRIQEGFKTAFATWESLHRESTVFATKTEH